MKHVAKRIAAYIAASLLGTCLSLAVPSQDSLILSTIFPYTQAKAATDANYKIESSTYNSVTLVWTKIDGESTIRRTESANPSTTVVVYKGAGSSFTDKDLKLGVTYVYELIQNDVVNDTKVTYTPQYSAISDLSVSNYNEKKIVLNWTKVDGFSSYNVYRSTQQTYGFSKIGSAQSAFSKTVQYSDTSIQSNTTYYYYVVPVEAKTSQEGTSSNVVQVMTSLGAPSGLDVKNESNQIKLTWSKAQGGVAYNVYRSTSRDSGYQRIACVTDLYYTDTAISYDVTYYYRITALFGINESGYSETRQITISNPTYTTLTKPANLTGERISDYAIRLNWSPVSNAKKYAIYCASNYSTNYFMLDLTTSTTYIDTTVGPSNSYFYFVAAYNAYDNIGPSSDIITVGSPYANAPSNTDLAAPKKVKASILGTDQIRITWKSVSLASYYEVYMSTQKDSGYTKIGSTEKRKFTFSDFKDDTTYYFKVRAISGSLVSDYSKYASIDTSLELDDLDIDYSNGRISFTWDGPGGKVTYYIYRSTKKNSGYRLIDTTMDASYCNKKYSSKRTYYYRIEAERGSFSSEYNFKVAARRR